MREGMAVTALSLLAGLIFPLGLSPFDWWPAIPLSSGLLYICLNRDSSLAAWRSGLAYGAGFFGGGVSWVYVSIHVYGATPVWLALLLTAIFCGGLALLFSLQAHLYSKLAGRNPGWKIVQFTSLWVLFEWLRTYLLTGFPWAFAGYGVLDSPLSSWIPLIGIYGCSWLLVGLGCLTAEACAGRHHSRFWLAGGATATSIFIAGLYWQDTAWTHPTGNPIKVSAVQPNIPLLEKWDPRHRPQILEDFSSVSEQLYAESDLIVWPESALPGYRDQLESTLLRVDESATQENKTVIVGIPTRDAYGRYNSVTVLGAGQGTYHKQKLVPFGEYVPLEDLLRGAIAFFDLPMSQFVAGPIDQQPLSVGSISVAPFICYEVVYPDFVLNQSRTAELLITISNDTWFGNSVGPWQHFQMARFRAAELGKDLIRSTNDGVSAIIDWQGRVLVTTPQFSHAVLSGTVQPRAGETPFALTGSLPVWVLSLIGLVLGRDRP
jgi:apolipoprotein N-acyltransferase